MGLDSMPPGLLLERLTPCPENSMYFGGGGGTYFSVLLSSKPICKPFGNLFLSSLGILLFFLI